MVPLIRPAPALPLDEDTEEVPLDDEADCADTYPRDAVTDDDAFTFPA